jgi:hypothetical protein
VELLAQSGGAGDAYAGCFGLVLWVGGDLCGGKMRAGRESEAFDGIDGSS